MADILRLFCDQNIPVYTVDFLRSQGHDVVSTREIGISGASDIEILRTSIQQNRILMTYNSDFSDIRQFPPGTHSGIIRLKIHPQTAEIVHPILEKALGRLRPQQISGKLVTISENKVRIRGR